MKSVNERTQSIGGEELMKFLGKRFKMSKSQAIASMKKHKMDMSFLKKESVNEEWTLYTTTQYGKKLQKLKSYKSRKAATIALGKLSAKLDTPRFPKNVDGLMILDESIQLPHGMKLGKVFTGHGKSFVKEIFPKGAGRKISKAMQKGIEPQGNIKKVLDVAKNQQSKKIGGTLVDLTTANLMTQVWNKVNDSSKEKMNKMNAKQLTNLILRIWKGVGTPRV